MKATRRKRLRAKVAEFKALCGECRTISDLLTRGAGQVELLWGNELDREGETYGIGYRGMEFGVDQGQEELVVDPRFIVDDEQMRSPMIMSLEDIED